MPARPAEVERPREEHRSSPTESPWASSKRAVARPGSLQVDQARRWWHGRTACPRALREHRRELAYRCRAACAHGETRPEDDAAHPTASSPVGRASNASSHPASPSSSSRIARAHAAPLRLRPCPSRAAEFRGAARRTGGCPFRAAAAAHASATRIRPSLSTTTTCDARHGSPTHRSRRRAALQPPGAGRCNGDGDDAAGLIEPPRHALQHLRDEPVGALPARALAVASQFRRVPDMRRSRSRTPRHPTPSSVSNAVTSPAARRPSGSDWRLPSAASARAAARRPGPERLAAGRWRSRVPAIR